MKRGNTNLSFLLSVNKPQSMTSHDVINEVRRIFQERRVGHSGTLDPMATGVLPILVGPATKLSQYFNLVNKEYVAEITFGTSTDTHDAQGQVTEKINPPDSLYDESLARETLSKFCGRISQKPPIYSAIKINGTKAYEIARDGRVVDLVARDVTIYRADLLEITKYDQSIIWKVAFEVSSGTYIRSIVRDISNHLNCPAHLSSLMRTRVGNISLEDCHSLEELSLLKTKATLDPVGALGFRVILLSEKQSRNVENGLPIKSENVIMSTFDGKEYSPLPNDKKNDSPIFMATSSEVLAIYKQDSLLEFLKPSSVFYVGVSRGKSID